MSSNFLEKQKEVVNNFCYYYDIDYKMENDFSRKIYGSLKCMLAHRLNGHDVYGWKDKYVGLSSSNFMFSTSSENLERRLSFPLERNAGDRAMFSVLPPLSIGVDYGSIGFKNNSRIHFQSDITKNLTYDGIVAYLAMADKQDICVYGDYILQAIDNNAKNEMTALPITQGSVGVIHEIGAKYEELKYLSFAVIDKCYKEINIDDQAQLETKESQNDTLTDMAEKFDEEMQKLRSISPEAHEEESAESEAQADMTQE